MTQETIHNVGYKVLADYPQYDGGISANTMTWNGEEQPWQFIVRRNKPIAIFTSAYKLIPNQQALEISNDMANRAGMVKPSKMSKEAFYIPPSDVYWNKDETAFTSIYIDPKPHNIAPTGETEDLIYKGLAFKNSVNGWCALSASTFAFRKICQNMNYHFRSSRMLQESNIEIKDISVTPTESNQRMKILESIRLVHSQSLDTVKIQDSVADVIESGDQILRRYQEMQTEKLLSIKAEELRRLVQMPKSVTEHLDWLHTSKDKDGKVTAKFDDITKFKAYQDITEILTHKIGKITFESKLGVYSTIDKVLVQ